MTMQHLVFRGDSDAAMGTGHVMRCLALAGALSGSGAAQATFLVGRISDALLERIREEGYGIQKFDGEPGTEEDAEACLEVAAKVGADGLVLDGYHFNPAFQASLAEAPFRLLFFDDCAHLEHYPADFVVNQNLHASPGDYPSTAGRTQLLLGPRYAVLRSEFNAYRDWSRVHPETASNLLITLGGADPEDTTSQILEAILPLLGAGLQARVILGGVNPHGKEVQALARGHEGHVEVVRDASTMAEHMAWADMAICAGGTTVWELAYMQVPMLATVLADNQVPIVESLKARGLARSLGLSSQLHEETIREAVESLRQDRALRISMGEQGRARVDGYGGERLAARIGGEPHWIRPATERDMRQIWRWANEESTRARSFSQDPIPWDDHQDWFLKKLEDPSCKFFIATDHDGDPVGQVRFDVEGEYATISVSVGEAHRGQGHGTKLIERTSQRVLSDGEVAGVRAYIKHGNEASCKAFSQAGYIEDGEEKIDGHDAYRYILEVVSDG